VLDYQYRSLTDAIEVSALDQYLQDRRRMYDDMGFSIREPSAPVGGGETVYVGIKKPTTLATQPKWLLVFVLVAGAFAAVRRGYRWDPAPKWIDPAWPLGIRGWLIPFAIMMILGVVSWPITLWFHAGDLDVSKWGHLTGITQAVLLCFAIVGVQIQVALVLTAVLFFTRRSSTPALFIGTHFATTGWTLALLTFQAANHLLGNVSVEDVWSHEWPALIGLVVFVSYFLLSKRVKATFVKRYQPRGTLDGATVAA
jgi:hypothetical protein